MTRRNFLQQGSAAAALLLANAPLFADPMGLPIGAQTYPVKDTINRDFAGTMKDLAQAGFRTIELCSPFGYGDFASLKQYRGQDLKAMLNDWGLTCVSCHFGTGELFNHADERIAWAHDVGLTQMGTASLGFGTMPKDRKPNMDDIKRVTDQFNAFAAKAHAAGITAFLHNEGLETTEIDGKRVYDAEIALLDPATVKLQFQVSTLQQGFDPVDYFARYPGRYISMHCQDWVKDPSAKSGFRQVALGKGVVDWPKVFAAAKKTGIKNYYVELEDDANLMAPSVPYLHTLHV